MRKTTLTLIIITALFSCKKDSETCSWSVNLINGNTYKPTKFESMGVDVTSTVLLMDPCIGNSANFMSNGTYKIINISSCNNPTSSGTWSVSNSNGKNYLTIDGTTNEVTSFDCNNIVTTANFNGTLIKATITKQ